MLSTWTPKFIEPVRWLIIIGIAATLARTVLFFISGPQLSASVEATSTSTSQPQQRQPTSINAILSRNLFGAVNARAETQAVAAVQTSLPLELRGVFVGEQANDSAAIIAQKGKAEELYAIGGMLPGNAELVEVHADHVVLRRAGNLEVLKFPEFNATLISDAEIYQPEVETYDEAEPAQFEQSDEQNDFAPDTEEPAQTSRDSAQPVSPREFVDTYRERLEADPEGALSELGIAPVSADGTEGYRLDGLANSPYLSQTGLQPGDVVLSVNGSPVGNIQQDRTQIASILDQGSARLEVQRGTRRFFVTASLK